MLGALLDTGENEFRAVNVKDTLDYYYSALDCTCIDMVSRFIGDRQFLIICDDEGLLKADPVPSAFSSYGECMLVGSLLFLRDGEDGNVAPLTEEDVAYLQGHLRTYKMRSNMSAPTRICIVDCEY